MDVLAEILDSMRLTGGVVVDASTRGDWCLLSQFNEEDRANLAPGAADLVAYHYIRSGRVYARVEGGPVVSASAGDIILLPRNDAHFFFSRSDVPAIDSHDLLEWDSETGELARLVIDGPGEPTSFYCGFLAVSSERHPLLDCLPPILKLSSSDARRAEWLESSLRLMNEASNSPEVVARLAELFLGEAIRRCIEQLSPSQGGWLAGLRDPAVGKALAIIHSRYADDLDVETLARESGVSRTVLADRFVELLREPPMRYCAKWRMRIAANMLRDGKENTANIAHAVGFTSEAAFNRAFKREYGEPPATWRRQRDAEQRRPARAAATREPPPQQVHYCTARDGTRLAWSKMGHGRPLVKTANWLNHIEFDWESPIWKHWLAELTESHCLIRYDERGNGLSDWDTPELSFEAFVDDLKTVVDAAGAESFDLLGISQGAAVAIAYSLRHPERIRRMVLLGGYASGWRARGDNEEISRREAMLTLTELGWGKDNPAYRQFFTSFYIPGANAEQMSWFNELQRRSTSPDNAVRLMRVFSTIDVRHLLGSVRHPTLVLHARGDQAIPFSEGEALARGIPGAGFVPLDSNNHILLDGEPAFRTFIDEVRSFLAAEEPVAA